MADSRFDTEFINNAREELDAEFAEAMIYKLPAPATPVNFQGIFTSESELLDIDTDSEGLIRRARVHIPTNAVAEVKIGAVLTIDGIDWEVKTELVKQQGYTIVRAVRRQVTEKSHQGYRQDRFRT